MKELFFKPLNCKDYCRFATFLKLFSKALQDGHKLHSLTFPVKECSYSVRRYTKFVIHQIQTEHFKNSFIVAISILL